MTAEPLILIVDDDEGLRRSLQFLFASAGLESQSWDSAEAFLADLPAGGPVRPGALVLDCRMPGMGGLALLRLLGERGYPLPVVIITGHGDVRMAVEALKTGPMTSSRNRSANSICWIRSRRRPRCRATGWNATQGAAAWPSGWPG